MPNADVSKIYADNLGALPHPDGTPVVLANFSSASMPQGMRDAVATEHKKASTAIGDALVHTAETNGWTHVRTPELEQLRIKAAAFDKQTPPMADVICDGCGAPLLHLNITNPKRVSASGRTIIRAMHNLTPECGEAGNRHGSGQ